MGSPNGLDMANAHKLDPAKYSFWVVSARNRASITGIPFMLARLGPIFHGGWPWRQSSSRRTEVLVITPARAHFRAQMGASEIQRQLGHRAARSVRYIQNGDKSTKRRPVVMYVSSVH